MLKTVASILPGSPHRKLARWQRVVPRIEQLTGKLNNVSGADLRKQAMSLRYRVRSGESLDRLLPDAFALVCEAASRQVGLRHYPVQILGGIALHHGCIAEMETGEGKTLTATLPMFLNALAGKGTHLATANDYLARRDADWMGPVYESLGMTVGVIESQMPPSDRKQAYACDITYGTAKEFGFDFLRDRLQSRKNQQNLSDTLALMLGQSESAADDGMLNPRSHFALIDEADSILIDEARTPLIIGAFGGDDMRVVSAAYRWAAHMAESFEEDRHFAYDKEVRNVELNAAGRQLMRTLPKPSELDSVSLPYLHEYIERAIKVERDFQQDRHYVIRDGEVVIVDEFTGRLAEGRKWRGGIHQAIEAKDQLEVTRPTGQAAQITVQELFSRYDRLAGMTGTASSSARELKKMYGTLVVQIPTNRPNLRKRLPDRIFRTEDDKWDAIVDEVQQILSDGRAVLIGTRSIDKSETLSARLSSAGITHRVLNAMKLVEEANIVTEAGEPGKVTVATNMAGRGTDITLGEGVAEKGGLHVICTELHDSARIDRQLAGRSGRQGDRGSYRQYLALDDDILATGLGTDKADQLRKTHQSSAPPLDHLGPLFRQSQQKVERKHFRERQVLMHLVKQRIEMQTQMGQDPFLDTPS